MYEPGGKHLATTPAPRPADDDGTPCWCRRFFAHRGADERAPRCGPSRRTFLLAEEPPRPRTGAAQR